MKRHARSFVYDGRSRVTFHARSTRATRRAAARTARLRPPGTRTPRPSRARSARLAGKRIERRFPAAARQRSAAASKSRVSSETHTSARPGGGRDARERLERLGLARVVAVLGGRERRVRRGALDGNAFGRNAASREARCDGDGGFLAGPGTSREGHRGLRDPEPGEHGRELHAEGGSLRLSFRAQTDESLDERPFDAHSRRAGTARPRRPLARALSARARACISAIVSTASPSTAARTSTSREGAPRSEASFDVIVDAPRRPGVRARRRRGVGEVNDCCYLICCYS